MKTFFTLILLYIFAGIIEANRIPLIIPSSEDVEERMEFNLILPNKDIVEVDLYVRFIKSENSTNELPSTTTTTTAPNELPDTTTTTAPNNRDNREPGLISVKEAIDVFKRELIRKESEIGGIIESRQPFYRHFQFDYGKNSIKVRCEYISNHRMLSLTINCLEYRKVSETNLLANGEMEVTETERAIDGSELEYIDFVKYKQSLHMNIN